MISPMHDAARWAAGTTSAAERGALRDFRDQLTAFLVLDRAQRERAPGAVIDALLAIPFEAGRDALAHPVAALWANAGEGGGVVPITAAAAGLAGTTLAAATVDLPAVFSLCGTGWVVHRAAAGPLTVTVGEDIDLSDPSNGDRLSLPPRRPVSCAQSGSLRATRQVAPTGLGIPLDLDGPELGLCFGRSPLKFDVDTWRARLDRAQVLLGRVAPHTLDELGESVRAIVPMSASVSDQHSTGSHRHAWGAVHTTLVPEPYFTGGIVHEHRHDQLNALCLVEGPLTHEDGTERCYSPWRPDVRPAFGLLHAVYVFAGVAELLRLAAHAPEIDVSPIECFEAAATDAVRMQLAAEEVRRTRALSTFGNELLAALANEASRLRALLAAEGAFLSGRVLGQLLYHLGQWRTEHGREPLAVTDALVRAMCAA